MAEKTGDVSNKDLAKLEKTLNQRLQGSGVEFGDLHKNTDGTVGLSISMSADKADPHFFMPKGMANKLVNTLPDRSFLNKFNLGNQYQELLGKINAMGVDDIIKAVEEGKDVTSVVKQVKQTQDTLLSSLKESALNLRFRDPLTSQDLDLREKSVDQVKAQELYARSSQEYERTGIYGSSVDVFTNFASSGFYNEVSDPEILNFFDSWAADIKFKNVVGKIFHHLYKYNVAIVMPAYGAYEPHEEGVSSIPGKEPKSEKAAMISLLAKHTKSKGSRLTKIQKNKLIEHFDKEYASKSKKESAATTGIPIAYTLLNPEHVKIESSGFFGAATVSLTGRGMKDLKKSLDRQKEGKASKEEKERNKLLPTKLKAAALESEDYIFDKGEVFIINLSKDDHTAYAKPRGARIFDSLDYKDELIKADYATLDGIFNYILKVTVGDKDNPITDMTILEELAQAFNTPQKAFSVVWNHTLSIEKITTPDIGAILGKDKYEQVELDISAGLGIARAFIDGSDIQTPAAILAAKALQSQIGVARLQVEDWIYLQYKIISMARSFERFPAIRWIQSTVNTDSDAVARASTMQTADRKLRSQATSMRDLGTDPDVEQQRIRDEIPLEEEGVKISGSPFQATEDGPAPSGDQGRPKSQPKTTKKKPDDKKVVKRKTTVTSPSQQSAGTDRESQDVNDLLAAILKLPKAKQKVALEKFLALSDRSEDGG